MSKLQSLILAISLLVGSLSVATAQDFDKGIDAYKAGDYQTAMLEWRPLAEQGYAPAQFGLGQLYYHGRGGVLQDYAQALMWYQRAANQGLVHGQNGLGIMYAQGIGELLSNLVFEGSRSCGDLVCGGDFNSVFEPDAGDDFSEVIKAA